MRSYDQNPRIAVAPVPGPLSSFPMRDQKRFQVPVSTLSLFVAVVALTISLFLTTYRHNSQLRDMTRRHNAQLVEQAERHNAQLREMTDRDHSQLKPVAPMKAGEAKMPSAP